MRLKPDERLGSVRGITPEWLEQRGLRGLILDLDNTLAYYRAPAAPPEIEAWLRDMAGKAKLAVCSNSREKRVLGFCGPLGLSYVHTARKPKADGLHKAAGLLGLEAREIAMVGDQVFTDVLAARRAGMTAVLVEPVKNVWIFRVRRWFENFFVRCGMSVIFGPAGNADSFNEQYKSTLKAPEWLRAMGLTAFEYQCGHGVTIGQATAQKLGALMAENGITLSLHGPYYIILTNPDNFEKNVGHLRKACRAAQWMGAKRVVVHSGIAGKGERRTAFQIAADTLTRALEILRAEGLGDVSLCPEVMGKISQLGTLEEVLELCALDASLVPCVDFGHLYARTLGEFAAEEHFERACELMEAKLGVERARKLHVHFSHIEFKAGGEYKHLTLDDKNFGPDFAPLAAVMKPRGYEPAVICESRGTQAEDACRMRDMWEAV